MGFLEKAKFWKKHDDFSFDQDSSANTGSAPGFADGIGGQDSFSTTPPDTGLPPDPMRGGEGTNDPFTMNQTPTYPPTEGQQLAHKYMQSQQPVQTPQQQTPEHQDQKIEMMNLKLDAIKSELDALNQHIKKLEVMIERSGAKRW